MCGGGQNQPFGQSTGQQQPFGPQTGGMNNYMPKSFPGFDGSTQNLGNGMGMRQMGPSMLPPNRSQPMRFDGSTQDLGNGMAMRQMGPTTLPIRGPDYTDPSMPRPMMGMPQTAPTMAPPQRNADPFAAERARLGMGSYAGAAYGGPKNHGGVGPAPGPTLPPAPVQPGQPPQPGAQPGGGQPPWQSPENTYLAGPTAGFLGMSKGPPPDPRMMWHQQSGQYQLVPGWNGYNPTGR